MFDDDFALYFWKLQDFAWYLLDLGTGHFLWVGGKGCGFWGRHPKIFELKGGPSQKLKAEEVFYR